MWKRRSFQNSPHTRGTTNTLGVFATQFMLNNVHRIKYDASSQHQFEREGEVVTTRSNIIIELHLAHPAERTNKSNFWASLGTIEITEWTTEPERLFKWLKAMQIRERPLRDKESILSVGDQLLFRYCEPQSSTKSFHYTLFHPFIRSPNEENIHLGISLQSFGSSSFVYD